MRQLTILEMTDEWFEEMCDELLNLFWRYLFALQNAFSLELSSVVEPTAVTMGGKTFKFPLACELYRLMKYAKGEWSAPEEFHDILQSVIETVWSRPFALSDMEITWSTFEQEKVGFLVSAAVTRKNLDDGADMNAAELAKLIGLSPTGVTKMINEGKIKAEKEKAGWVIPNEEAKRIMKERGFTVETSN